MVCPTCAWEGDKKTCPTCKKQAVYSGRIFHDLRRSAIRNMIKAGVAPQIAKKVSGHKTDSVFQRYNIITTDDVRDALTKTETHRKTSVSNVVAMGQ
jgi:hypothetical protein